MIPTMDPRLRIHQKRIFGVTDVQFHILTDAYSISEKTLKESVAILKNWFHKEPHLPKIKIEDHYFEIMLGINKFNVERTKSKIDNFFTVRSIIPEFFTKRDPLDPVISKALDSSHWLFSPKLTPEKYRILLLKVGGKDPEAYDPESAVMASFLISDIKMFLDISCGDVYIWDMEHLRLSHILKLTPAQVKKIIFVVQNCYGARIKSIHVINLPKYAESLMNMVKTLLKKKIGDRMFFHRSLDDLHKVIPKEYLPKDYGGDDPRTSEEISDELRSVVKSPEWRSWFLESVNIKTNELKRIKESETWLDDLIGMKGTFRKLDID